MSEKNPTPPSVVLPSAKRFAQLARSYVREHGLQTRRKPKKASRRVERIAELVVAKLGPAISVAFISETNAEPVSGQSFDWWVGVAKRLGVPVHNVTGRKRVIDVEVLRTALAASAPIASDVPTNDPVTTVRRMLNERLNGGNYAP